MTSDEQHPVGAPVPRIDSFEAVGADGPYLTDEETTWPVAAPQPRNDSFEVIGPPGEPEVVIRVRCAAAATPAEVRAYAELLRAAVEGVRAPAKGALPPQISY